MKIIYKIKLYLHVLLYRGIKEKAQYSINGEDLFLSNYFKDVPKGRYIDIGAFHPFRSSNTKVGLDGITTEMNRLTKEIRPITEEQYDDQDFTLNQG